MGVVRIVAVAVIVALAGSAFAGESRWISGSKVFSASKKEEQDDTGVVAPAERRQAAAEKKQVYQDRRETTEKTPADGFTIHVTAPHQMEDGKIEGPYHHYCKPVQEGKVLQCLLFESDSPNAALVGVEYFVEKNLARKNVPLIQWNRHFHDHELEIASGRVKVLDASPAETKEIVKKAANTDGVIFHLWQYDAPIPDGKVTFPQAVGHVFRAK